MTVNTITKLEVTDYSKNHGGVRVMIEGRECSICSVVGYALYNKEDPVDAVLRTMEKMVSHPYNGHKLVWINLRGTMLTDSRERNEQAAAERAAMPQLTCADRILFEGRVYDIAPTFNNNFNLVPV